MWGVNNPPYYMQTSEIVQAIQSLDELSKREGDYDLYRRRFLWQMHEQHIRRDMLRDVADKLKQVEQQRQQAEAKLSLQDDRIAGLERQLQQLLAAQAQPD